MRLDPEDFSSVATAAEVTGRFGLNNQYWFDFKSMPPAVWRRLNRFFAWTNASEAANAEDLFLETTISYGKGFSPEESSDGFFFELTNQMNSFEFGVGSLHRAVFNMAERRFDITLSPDIEGNEETILSGKALKAAFRIACVTQALLEDKALYVHGALGIHGSSGILFPASSGTGKTTLSNGFNKVFAQADDVALINFSHVSHLCVSPCATRKMFWPNVTRPHPARLRAIAFLEQSKSGTSVVPIDMKEAFERLVRQVVEYSKEPKVIQKALELSLTACKSLPCFVVRRDLNDLSSDDIFNDILSRVESTC